ncbi:Protein of unknown function (DUF3527 [Striga hermonthica]|uniref:Uncharacterized protein n=1 Tax=Striga hermonthica TaxID=68872 RepID=A0A9N7REI0_STRHE|nr:Protein of unknown function (DUF3527 [Striga hermonthica]
MAKPEILTGSQSMNSILNSPLLKKSGSTNLWLYSDYSDFPNSLSNLSKPENEVMVLNRKKCYACPPGHKRAASTTSFFYKSSSLASATSFQGMLQCKLRDGMPYYVFSIEDTTNVYAASLLKVEPSGDNGFDYIYDFCSNVKRKEELGDQEIELQSLCRMKVSTSITLCPNSSSEVKETRYVVSFSSEDHCINELKISHHYRKRSQRLVSKVTKVFRSSHSFDQRTSGVIFEDSTWDPCESVETGFENEYVQNLEVAAIIVKDTFKDNSMGGWGLKFLKKCGKDVPLTMILPMESCSTSFDVLIPAGIHGGPKTGESRPANLVERWISGGVCDCGGWDLGCPLKVLNMRPSGANSWYSMRDCKSIDLFLQGSKEDVPIFKMTMIQEGLYCIRFQTTLSTVQSFAIAAATIHAQSPVHR